MKTVLIVLIALMTLDVTAASAQTGDISGRYRCIQRCKGGLVGPAFVTHADSAAFDFELVDEAGQPARAWIDFPGHFWVEDWQEGAVFALDGLTIRFDNGTVWRRYTMWEQYLPPLPPPQHRLPPR